jgi:hypothetical protein
MERFFQISKDCGGHIRPARVTTAFWWSCWIRGYTNRRHLSAHAWELIPVKAVVSGLEHVRSRNVGRSAAVTPHG